MRLYRQPLMLSRLVPVARPQDMSLCVKVLWNLGTGPQLVATTPERVQATVQDLSALQRVPAWPVGRRCLYIGLRWRNAGEFASIAAMIETEPWLVAPLRSHRSGCAVVSGASLALDAAGLGCARRCWCSRCTGPPDVLSQVSDA